MEKRVMVLVVALLIVFTLAAAIFLFLIRRGEEHHWPPLIKVNDSVIYGIDNDYRNENVRISFTILNAFLRDVGDSDRGLTVGIRCPQWDWKVTADVRGELNYVAGYVEKSGFEAMYNNKGIGWRLRVPVTSNGSFEEGMAAELLLWTDNDLLDNEYAKVNPNDNLLLTEYSDLLLTISSFDFEVLVDAPLSKTSISQ